MKENVRKEVIKEINAYLKENIEDFEIRVEAAYGVMDRCRCPLEHADANLHSEIVERAQEWFNDEFLWETEELV